MEDSEADGREGEVVLGIDQSGMSVVADAHATQSLDPAEDPFDGPAESAQVRTVWTISEADGGVDAASRQRIPFSLAVVFGVGEEEVW